MLLEGLEKAFVELQIMLHSHICFMLNYLNATASSDAEYAASKLM